MDIDPKLERLLGKVFDSASSWANLKKSDPEKYKQLRFDFIFHMTDWMSDLEELHDLYQHPEKADPNKTCTLIIGLLYHVIPHLNAAGRLLLDEVPDPFKKPTRETKARTG